MKMNCRSLLTQLSDKGLMYSEAELEDDYLVAFLTPLMQRAHRLTCVNSSFIAPTCYLPSSFHIFPLYLSTLNLLSCPSSSLILPYPPLSFSLYILSFFSLSLTPPPLLLILPFPLLFPSSSLPPSLPPFLGMVIGNPYICDYFTERVESCASLAPLVTVVGVTAECTY